MQERPLSKAKDHGDPDEEKSSVISRFPSKRSLHLKPPALSPAPAPRSGQLAAPDVTLTIRRSVAAPARDSEHSDRQSCTDLAERGGLGEGREASEAEEQKEQIYESLNTFHHELTVAKVDSKGPTTTATTCAPSSDNLYAKVKKLSGNSGGNNTNHTNNLNSEFMSIYELTKVETTNETSQPEESRVDITNKL